MRQLVSTTVEVVDETSAAAENRSTVAATDGGATTGVVHPLFVDIDDDEYTDSLLEIQR